MAKMGDIESFAEELSSIERQFEERFGTPLAKLWRAPEGAYSEQVLHWANELGYKTVFWSLAYADWDNNAQPTKEQAFEKLLPRIHNGAVVLLHSTSATNAAVLDEVITKWKEMGYTFGSLAELCGDNGAH
jgi:peptidoglycan-N-acetylmuramic acid deacetylase